MTEMVFYHDSFLNTESSEVKLGRSRDRWKYMLFSSTVLGFTAGSAGLFFSILPWFLPRDPEGISSIGTWLTVAFFPLLILAAHSLDKIRDAEKALRLQYCRRHGLKEKDC
ncbi:MAG: hypothetical protein H7070_11000 [Saprospiraceae bacterium]|nr:hypothetical protein [Pyrinomonadaceae bacterium]